jgi:hypothetical protein
MTSQARPKIEAIEKTHCTRAREPRHGMVAEPGAGDTQMDGDEEERGQDR